MMQDTTQVVPDNWRALNATQRDILLALAIRGTMQPTNINAALGRPDAHPNTITRNLRGLRERGLVEAVSASDNRGPGDHELTPDGWTLVGAIRDAYQQVDV